MIHQDSLLVTLVKLVDRIPVPPPPAERGPGRPKFYPDRLFLKALLIMIVRHLHKVHELLSVLEQPTDEITIADAGLPIPKETQRIDLALRRGIPTFEDTLRTVLEEMCVEKAFVSEEQV